MTFTDWLRLRMEQRGYSQRWLALRAGVNHSTLTRLLAEDRVPTLNTAQKLAAILGGWNELGPGH